MMNLVQLQVKQLFAARVQEEQQAGHLYPVDLREYQVGSPHYEQLQRQMADAHRWTWPAQMEVN